MIGVPTNVLTKTRIIESEAGPRTFYFHQDGSALAMETDLLDWLDLRRIRYPLRRQIRTFSIRGALGEVESVYSAAARSAQGKWIDVLSREQLLTLIKGANISVPPAALQSVLHAYDRAEGIPETPAVAPPAVADAEQGSREASPATPCVEMVHFAGGLLSAVRSEGQGWLVLKPACEALGIDHEAQRKRLDRTAWAVASIMEATGADRKQYQMFCLRSDRVAMWLATIDTGRITDPEARQRLETWQCHAADALDAWWRGPASSPGPSARSSELHDFVVATAEQVVRRMLAQERLDGPEPCPATEPAASQDSPPDWSTWLSPSRVAEHLGVDVRRVYHWVRTQQLEHHRLGSRDVRIHPDALRKFLAGKHSTPSLH